MKLHQQTIDQVRERAQIVDQFDSSKLKKMGHEFVTHCPWHDDRSPSLSISPQKNFVYCPVCARGEDPIGWVIDQQGLSFTEVVIFLAKQYNIEVQAADAEDTERYQREREERAKLYTQREQQREQFHENLWDAPAFEYLLGRGLEVETLLEWQLGWSGNRVMFPLNDPQGRTVGFTGRVLDDSKPKYKNSSNDALYQKAEMVFGLDKARDEIIRSGTIVICEGQFDVIRLWQEGIRNVVAVSGSSLTKPMIERIVKSCKVSRVVLCFDGDLGGEKAADRAIIELQDFALRGELDLQILAMPEGCDPADCAEAFVFLLAEAVSWVAYQFERAVSQLDLNDPNAIAQAERGVKKILKILPVGGLREYVQRRAKEVLKAVPLVAPAKIQTEKQINKCRWAERRALRLYLLDEHCRPALMDISYTDPQIEQAWGAIQTLEAMGATGASLRSCFLGLIQKFDRDLGNELQSLAHPIAEVLRIIQKNPVNELEGALAILMTDCCQGADNDRYPKEAEEST